MKTNLVVILTLCLIIVSCSKDKKLLKDAEKFLKAQLNDPDSYKRDSLMITLKVTYLQNRKNEIHQNLYVNKRVIMSLKETNKKDSADFISLYSPFMKYVRMSGTNKIKERYEDDLWELNLMREFRNKKIDSLKNVYNSLFQDSIKVFAQSDNQLIHRIVIKDTFRAKNSFGAYIKQTAWIIWYPEKGFELTSIE